MSQDRSAVYLSLAAKERRQVEERITKAYAGQGDALLEEVVELLGAQAWPNANPLRLRLNLRTEMPAVASAHLPGGTASGGLSASRPMPAASTCLRKAATSSVNSRSKSARTSAAWISTFRT